jgi:1,4-dihydroxy-2-naphthoate polyprenyltransferase
LGDRRTRVLYVGLVVVAFALGLACAWARPPAALLLLAIPLAWVPVRHILAGIGGRALVPVLVETGQLQLGFGAVFALGLALGG